jgi:Ni/Co efflux regulator RcnB
LNFNGFKLIFLLLLLLHRAQLELAEKERDQEHKVRSRQKNFSENLQKQIRENELLRIQERKQFFEEGVRLDEEARARRAKLDDIKRKKLEELK